MPVFLALTRPPIYLSYFSEGITFIFLEKMVDSTRVNPTLLVGVDPFLSFVKKKIPIIELNCKIYLAYILRFTLTCVLNQILTSYLQSVSGKHLYYDEKAQLKCFGLLSPKSAKKVIAENSSPTPRSY